MQQIKYNKLDNFNSYFDLFLTDLLSHDEVGLQSQTWKRLATKLKKVFEKLKRTAWGLLNLSQRDRGMADYYTNVKNAGAEGGLLLLHLTF